MCLALYVGSDRPLEGEVEGVELLPLRGPRRVRRVLERRLDKPEVYELAIDKGCACGFIDEESPPDPDVLAARDALVRLLERLLPQAGGTLDLFACWTSDEKRPADERLVDLERLRQETFADTWDRPVLFKLRATTATVGCPPKARRISPPRA